MAPTFSKRTRAIKQEYGSNTDAWGGQLNIGAIDIHDEAWGTVEVAVNGAVTLTVENGLADQSRGVVLIFTGTGGTVTHPAVDKPYVVINNCAGAVTLQPQAGTGVSIKAGKRVWYYTNAAGDIGYALDQRLSDLLAPTEDLDMGGKLIRNAAPAVLSTDVPTLGQIQPLVDTAVTAAETAVAAAQSADEDAVEVRVLYTDFLSRYLGAYSTEPAADPLGNPVQTGAIYWNTVENILFVWNGSLWMALPVIAIPVATKEQAEEGENNAVFMTPLRVAQAITALAGDIVIEHYTSSGDFVKHDDDLWYYVRCIGAGSGGAWGGNVGTTFNRVLGGQAGEVVDWLIAAVDLDAITEITIGAGGAGRTTQGVGNVGGDTKFGSHFARGGRAVSYTPSSGTEMGIASWDFGGAFGVTTSMWWAEFARITGAGASLNVGMRQSEILTGIVVDGPTHGGCLDSGSIRVPASSRLYGTGGNASTSPSGIESTDGGDPGGGGGAMYNNSSTTGLRSGSGGRGEVIVWRFRRIKA